MKDVDEMLYEEWKAEEKGAAPPRLEALVTAGMAGTLVGLVGKLVMQSQFVGPALYAGLSAGAVTALAPGYQATTRAGLSALSMAALCAIAAGGSAQVSAQYAALTGLAVYGVHGYLAPGVATVKALLDDTK